LGFLVIFSGVRCSVRLGSWGDTRWIQRS